MSRALRYIAAAGAVLAAIVGTTALHGLMGTSVSILFFPAVLLTAIYGGSGPALVATVLSTLALAHYFVPPYTITDIGADDAVRLTAFSIVAVVGGSISSARRRADQAQRRAVADLRTALGTLRKVSGWPVFVDVSFAGAAWQLLAHAASVMACERVVATWEADDEPWIYLASSAGEQEGIVKFPPTALAVAVPRELQDAAFVSNDPAADAVHASVSGAGAVTTWEGSLLAPDVSSRLAGRGVASAPFRLEHLTGRLFCSGLSGAGLEIVPLVNVVAHEVGTSLERLYLHDRLQQVAVREERIRVARDLHDGVLQSLTGIRLRVQTLADHPEASSEARAGLLAVERGIASEQRELRLFIDGLKPQSRRVAGDGLLVHLLDQLRDRLAAEWKTPIAVRVTPDNLSAPPGAEQTVRLLVQEAVVNALKHAQPSRVSVEIDAPEPGALRVVVSNDGRGFGFSGRRTHAQLVASGGGPVSLRERLVSVGGSLAIESMAVGSRLEMLLPVQTSPLS
ncbi:MAG: hypothetical protein V7647_2309 [Acidobacteriota bacterium]|jgi:signal transduction histidine kinase